MSLEISDAGLAVVSALDVLGESLMDLVDDDSLADGLAARAAVLAGREYWMDGGGGVLAGRVIDDARALAADVLASASSNDGDVLAAVGGVLVAVSVL